MGVGQSKDPEEPSPIRVVKAAPTQEEVKFTAYSIPVGEDDVDVSKQASVKPLIEGSEKPWAFKPVPSNLDTLDSSHIKAMQEIIQAHLRRSHLLVDCGQVRVAEQMKELEVQSAVTIHTFTRMVSEGNRDMKLIGAVAEELASQTRAAHNVVSKLVDLTLRLKQCLPEHDQRQLDQGSALYRMTQSRTRSGSLATAALLLGLQDSPGEKAEQFWMETALPRWDEVGADVKLRWAKRGVPSSLRGEVWIKAIGNGLHLTEEQWGKAAHKDYQAEGQPPVDPENVQLIAHDVPRTFHRLQLFANPKESFTQDLIDVLERFARFNPVIGYVQGMGYLAGMLLLNMSSYHCWVSLTNFFVDNHLFTSLFRMNVPCIVQHARIYEMILSQFLPDVYGHLKELSVTSDHYLLEWWMTLFCRKLPLRLVARIWDLYLLGGEIQLHRAALALMRVHREQLLQSSFEETIKLLSSPVDDLDETTFIRSIDSIKVASQWLNVLVKIK